MLHARFKGTLRILSNTKNMSLIFLILFFTIAALPPQLGAYDAKMLVEGAPGSYKISIDLNESITDLTNKTFVLVTIQDGNYYFVEKRIPAPLQSPLYSIPITKVKMAKIIQIGDNKITSTPFNRTSVIEQIILDGLNLSKKVQKLI
jgi:hypothetical protein